MTIQKLIDVAEIFQSLIPLDCCIMVCNEYEEVVKFVPANTFDMKAREGTKVAKGGALEDCLQTGKNVQKTISSEAYGVPIKAIGMPLFDNNKKLLGGIAIGISLANQNTLIEAAQTIAATSQQMTATSEELAANASTLSDEINCVRGNTDTVFNEIKKTDQILAFVRDIAANSNLLGLNAAIEAARAGEQGRGFSVVANEIRKMADSSTKAVKDIQDTISTIQNEALIITEKMKETAVLAERQAAATEEISAAMQQLASSSFNVEKVAKII